MNKPNSFQWSGKAAWKTRRLSPTGKILLAEIIPILESLQAGKTLLIQNPSPAQIDQIRSHLYTYFSETTQKAYFRTVRESATSLRVICQDLTPSQLSISALSPIEEFVRSYLLSCETHEEARLACLQAHASGELTDETLLEALEEWEKKCGGVSKVKQTTTYRAQGPARTQGRIDPLNGTVEGSEGKERE